MRKWMSVWAFVWSVRIDDQLNARVGGPVNAGITDYVWESCEWFDISGKYAILDLYFIMVEYLK